MLVRFFTIPSLAYAEHLSIQLENTVYQCVLHVGLRLYSVNHLLGKRSQSQNRNFSNLKGQ